MPNRIMRWLLPCLGLVFFLLACDSGGNPLADTEWRLVAQADAGSPPGQLGATQLWSSPPLRWTEAGCPSQALFQQEQRTQDSLATVERFEVSGERLTLHGEGGRVLVFERVGK